MVWVRWVFATIPRPVVFPTDTTVIGRTFLPNHTPNAALRVGASRRRLGCRLRGVETLQEPRGAFELSPVTLAVTLQRGRGLVIRTGYGRQHEILSRRGRGLPHLRRNTALQT